MKLRAVKLAGLTMAAAATLCAMPPPAQAIRVATWNLLFYPGTSPTARQPHFRTVMAGLSPDVLIVQELGSSAGVDSFLTNVLNVVEPGQWASTAFFTLQDPPIEGSCVFYKPAKVSVQFPGVVPVTSGRDALVARIVPVGYTNINATFRVYSVHFKAGEPDSATRRLEATELRTTINSAPANTNFVVGGDMNLYRATEGAYIRLTESQPDNDGRCKDQLTMPGNWNSNPVYAPYHTQSPCLAGCPGSTGGMDDRFDLLLSSYNMTDGEGVDVVPGTYLAYGNDGAHYNDNINGGGFNNAVGITIANALRNASDHLPVMLTVQVAAKVAAASQLSFGSVLIGATAEQTLDVSNPAIAPADELDYMFAAPAGFTAPAGGFQAQPGAAANAHTLGMATGTVGVKSGTLAMSTDDRDSLTKNVQLSGTVLAHAVASLDSAAIVDAQTLDFGTRPIGAFADSAVRVHNLGWNALQARLSVESGVITDGSGRFSLAGGFKAALLAGEGRSYVVHFDDSGATPDTTYEATLTFGSADEALPGAAPASPLVVQLLATTAPATGGVEQGAPAALRFYPPRPNPLTREAVFAFDLPRAANVTLNVFDLSGRRVASVVAAELGAGEHRVRWSARDEAGARLGAGLYFARFSTQGLNATQRLVVLP